MTHRPDVEELLSHTIRDHGCDAARGLMELERTEAIRDATTLTLAAPVDRVINLTDVLADRLLEKLPEIHALHDSHHGSAMFETLTEERQVTHV